MNQTEEAQELERLRALSTLLDSRFTGPLGIRYGLDGLLGLIPGAGDVITSGLSIYIILRAARLGCSSPVLLRMTVNVMVENVADMLPLLGNFFDFYWKANERNIDLLEKHLKKPGRMQVSSTLVLLVVLMALVFSLLAGAYVSYRVLAALVEWFKTI